MNKLTQNEVLLILDLIVRVYGRGYAADPKVAALQAKLSIMLEVLSR
jgi:hypothetical protein